MLEASASEMPADWKPCRDAEGSTQIAFWNREEFLAHAKHHGAHLKKPVYWVPGSYSKSWYLLALMATEEERFEDAFDCLTIGLELEPDHPELWCELGYLLGQIEEHEDALQCYEKATSAREWAPALYMGRALRGQGAQLIDLGRLDEAEAAFRRSLEFEPDSENARSELEYIEELRLPPESREERVPWFLHSAVNPPKDPLTIRLRSLVKSLPAIPGPKTIGPENYERILQAFMARGWEGFEEEFDRIVPRHRPDYEEVKRDLLREPLFKL